MHRRNAGKQNDELRARDCNMLLFPPTFPPARPLAAVEADIYNPRIVPAATRSIECYSYYSPVLFLPLSFPLRMFTRGKRLIDHRC